MISWIKKIRDYDNLKEKHISTALEYNDRLYKICVGIAKLKKRIGGNKAHFDQMMRDAKKKMEERIQELEKELEATRFELLLKEPERDDRCAKPRLDGGRSCIIEITDLVSRDLKKPMSFYRCTICPPSPLTKQRYYHLTSKIANKDRRDIVGLYR